MDTYKQSLLRRYVSGDQDDALAHRIVNCVLRINPVPKIKYQIVDANRPKTITDIAHILTSDIVPLSIISIYHIGDDSYPNIDIMFLANDQLFRWIIFDCEEEIITACKFIDESQKAFQLVAKAILENIWSDLELNGLDSSNSKEELISGFNEK